MYSFMSTQLAQFDRAIPVASAYQHYKIKRIQVTIKPVFNMYGQNYVGPTNFDSMGKPQLYFLIDKAGALNTSPTLEALKEAGARPFEMSAKGFKITWRPSVLLTTNNGSLSGSLAANKYQISPWLNTNATPGLQPWAPSEVSHLGCYWYVESRVNEGSPALVPQFIVDVEVQFQFKKPIFSTAASGVPSIPVSLGKLDTSADGVDDNPT